MTQADAWNMELVGHTDLGGRGDCMGVQVVDGIAYVGHMGTDGASTSVVDVSDPAHPQLVRQLEPPAGTRSHKVQVVEDLLVVNCERNPWGGPDGGRATSWTGGLRIYDISDRTDPQELGFLAVPGKGVHRMTFPDMPYAYMSASDDGFTDQFFFVADLSDPANPVEAGRWWLPGMHVGGGEQPDWPDDVLPKHHHPQIRGNRAYMGWWDAGLVILDISNIEKPELVSNVHFGRDVSANTHTAMPLPGRDLLVVTDEALAEHCQEVPKRARVVDISDETQPTVLATFPVPPGDFCERGGRFGPHNVHEMRKGSFQSSTIVHMTYFNAGIRVFDVEDPRQPREVAHYVPPPHGSAPVIQLNDLFVDSDETIYVTDRRGGGLYILRRT